MPITKEQISQWLMFDANVSFLLLFASIVYNNLFFNADSRNYMLILANTKLLCCHVMLIWRLMDEKCLDPAGALRLHNSCPTAKAACLCWPCERVYHPKRFVPLQCLPSSQVSRCGTSFHVVSTN